MTAARTSGQPFRFSREQYFRLGNLGFFPVRRVERIRGEIVEMSPMSWHHSLGIRLTADALRTIFGDSYWVHDQSPITLVDSDPEPDVAVYPGSPRDYTEHPSNPLLIVEVAESSLSYDLTTKAELYATANLADYWVLDIANRQLHIFRDPQPIPDGGSSYRTSRILGEAESIAPLAMPDAMVRVSDLLP